KKIPINTTYGGRMSIIINYNMQALHTRHQLGANEGQNVEGEIDAVNTTEIGLTKEVDLNKDIVKIQRNEDTNVIKGSDDVFAVEVDDRGTGAKEGDRKSVV